VIEEVEEVGIREEVVVVELVCATPSRRATALGALGADSLMTLEVPTNKPFAISLKLSKILKKKL
jgi:hypothetical protein